jgi:hypothetical protein
MATTNVELPVGVTYRQFDYWCRTGYVHCDATGSGTARTIEDGEQAILNLMGRLVRAGIPAILAAKVAREAQGHGPDATVRIGDGLHIIVIGTTA